MEKNLAEEFRKIIDSMSDEELNRKLKELEPLHNVGPKADEYLAFLEENKEVLEKQLSYYKQLLLDDLCSRLPYNVCVHIRYKTGEPCYGKLTSRDIQWFIDSKIENIKPYLRPMSSMTEDEMVDYGRLKLSSDKIYAFSNYRKTGKGFVNIHTVDRKTGKETYTFQVNGRTMLYDGYVGIDWLNKKMFDYRGLIPMGLALPALEGMYNK